MTEPRIELIPSRQAVCSDETVVIDVLVRITPPRPEVHFPRVPLNLALVLDRSGSMSCEGKMPLARDAAAFAVKQLLATDRVSITIFDEEVETIVPGGPAVDKPGLVRRIEQITPRGSTNLHGGWAEGGRQADGGFIAGGINRVLLLSDGLANNGVVDPNTIAAEARGLAGRGVGTTTMGVGNDYNEDLMEAMARAGDGRYYYIESPTQLVDIFQTELQGLMDTLGQKVSLGLEPADGVAITEVLNDLEQVAHGPSDVAQPDCGHARGGRGPFDGAAVASGTKLLAVRLAWDAPRQRAPGAPRGTRRVAGRADGHMVGRGRGSRFCEQVALLMIARVQREAARAAKRGNHMETRQWLQAARTWQSSVPSSPETEAELTALNEMEAALNAGQNLAFIKASKFRSYNRREAQSLLPIKPPEPPPPPTKES